MEILAATAAAQYRVPPVLRSKFRSGQVQAAIRLCPSGAISFAVERNVAECQRPEIEDECVPSTAELGGCAHWRRHGLSRPEAVAGDRSPVKRPHLAWRQNRS